MSTKQSNDWSIKIVGKQSKQSTRESLAKAGFSSTDGSGAVVITETELPPSAPVEFGREGKMQSMAETVAKLNSFAK